MGTTDSYRREHEGFLQLFFLFRFVFFSFFFLYFVSVFLLASLPSQTGKMKISLLFVMVAVIVMATRFQPGDGHAISSQREKSDMADALLKDSHLDRQRREDSGHSRQETGFCNLLCHLAEKLGIRQRRENSDLQN